MRLLLAVAMLFTGCGHCMQTQPSCAIQPYGIIEFLNRTEERKISYVQRIYDGEPLGDPDINVIEPKTHHRYRLPVGIYEFGVKKIDGEWSVYTTKEALGACATLVVNVTTTKIEDKKIPIRPRRVDIRVKF